MPRKWLLLPTPQATEVLRTIQQGPENKGKIAKFKAQSPYLSLALGRLQLERWVGMASSTALRHPEGTTNNKGWGKAHDHQGQSLSSL